MTKKFAYLALCTFPAHAELLFHEPFDATAGTTLDALAPPTGASGSWVDTSSGAGTGTPSATFSEMTIRDNGTSNSQNWQGIPATSAYPNTGGYLEGLRRDNNEGHILLSTTVTDQFTAGNTIWLSFVAAAATNSSNDNNHEVNVAIGAGAFAGTEAGGDNRGQLHAGEAIGVGSDPFTTTSPLQATFWNEAGAQNLSAASLARIQPQQLIIAKIEFGPTDTITVGNFDVSSAFSLTEADFDAATTVTHSTALDESAFDTLAFDAVRANFDEFRIATTFDMAVGSSTPLEEVERRLTNMNYDTISDEFTLTWTSNPDDLTGIYWSEDLRYFFPSVHLAIPSSQNSNETTFGPFANPISNAPRMFLRLGDPDNEAPTLLSVSNDGREVRVTFSEPLLPGSPSDLTNYSLTGPNGAVIPISNASIGDPPTTVILTISQDLSFGTQYTLSVNDIADPAGNVIAANSESTFVPLDPAIGIPLIINEVMASNSVSPYNSAILLDEDGDSSDWIEIHNPLGFAINLDGWFLSDDDTNPTKWSFPSVVIPGNGYLLVFASNKNRTGFASELHTNFQLSSGGEYLGLSMPDQQTVSEFTSEYPEQVSGVSYGLPSASNPSPANYRYFDAPTPGLPNIETPFLGIVGDTSFDQDRGLYDDPFVVNLSSVTSGATIRYTLDMSEPTETNGLTFTPGIPIQVSDTTCLRARAFMTGWLPSNTDTQSYIFPDNVINQASNISGFPSSWGSAPADYAMNPSVTAQFTNQEFKDALLSLPTISIVTDMDHLFDSSSGIYSNPRSEGLAWERPTSVEWIDHTGGPEFQVDAGLRIQGNAARDLPKKPFRLLFKSIYGPSKLDFPMFPDAADAAESFDTIILRANAQGLNFGSRTQIADENGRRTALDMGTPQAHGTYAHLYVNGAYWGIYNPTERPQASFCENYIAGEKEEWDVNNGNAAIDGTYTPFDEMLAQVRGGAADDAAYQKIQGNNPDGTPNSSFPAYILSLIHI